MLMQSLRQTLLCGVIFLATGATNLYADPQGLTGQWELNYPSIGSAPVVWDIVDEGLTFLGDASVSTRFTTTNCAMDGKVLRNGSLNVASVECVTVPSGLTTSGFLIFTYEGSSMSGFYIDTISGIPIGFGELVGTKQSQD